MSEIQHLIQQQEAALKEMYTQQQVSLAELSNQQPILLVFLRHFGCTFCREALVDIAERRTEIEATDTKIVFVHMAEQQLAENYFHRYHLEGIDHISDPTCNYYAIFGLVKGRFSQLFGLQSWVRAFQTGLMDKYSLGAQLGDGFQMLGVFVIQNGEVKEHFIHKKISDRPDYEHLVACCAI